MTGQRTDVSANVIQALLSSPPSFSAARSLLVGALRALPRMESYIPNITDATVVAFIRSFVDYELEGIQEFGITDCVIRDVILRRIYVEGLQANVLLELRPAKPSETQDNEGAHTVSQVPSRFHRPSAVDIPTVFVDVATEKEVIKPRGWRKKLRSMLLRSGLSGSGT